VAETYFKIASVTVGSAGSSTITFTSIPQTYTDLKLVWSLRSSRSSVTDPIRVSFNSSSSSFTNKYLSGNSTTTVTGSSAQYVGEAVGNTATTSTFNNGELYIPNYTSANYKSASSNSVSENNASGTGDAVATIASTLWSNTAAITSITLSVDTGPNFLQYSTARLYGISNS